MNVHVRSRLAVTNQKLEFLSGRIDFKQRIPLAVLILFYSYGLISFVIPHSGPFFGACFLPFKRKSLLSKNLISPTQN